MGDTNTEYERFVRSIYEALLRAQGLETVKVQHDVDVKGLSRSHSIDVYWEYRLGGVLHRCIVNCKRYKDTVGVTDVLTLSGALQDMPGVHGLIVTTVGFQKEAIDYAEVRQIGLKVIRPPQEEDWEDRIYAVNIEARFNRPELIGCEVRFDRAWLVANVTADPDSLAGKSTHDARMTTVRDLMTGSVSDMNQLWNQAMRANPTEAGKEGTGILRWEDARLERPGHLSLKVKEIEFRWTIREGQPEILTVRYEPAAIVRDAIAGTLLFIDKNGAVTGDVEEELGSTGRISLPKAAKPHKSTATSAPILPPAAPVAPAKLTKLVGPDARELVDALLFTFTTHAKLAMMVDFGLGWNLEEVVPASSDLRVTTLALVRHAEGQGQLHALVAAALADAPGSPTLLAIAKKYPSSGG